MLRISPRFALLLGSVLTLSACSAGPQYAAPELSRMYDCNGADAMNVYSECDKPTHFEGDFVRFHDHDHFGDHDHGDPYFMPPHDHDGFDDHGGDHAGDHGGGHGGGHGR